MENGKRSKQLNYLETPKKDKYKKKNNKLRKRSSFRRH